MPHPHAAHGDRRLWPTTDRDDDDLHALGQLHGSDFEVVDTSSLRND